MLMIKKKVFLGWWMVLISAVVRFFESGTYFYGFTTFFNPIRETFGWGAAETSIAFSLQRLESGAMAPLSGFLTDRLGPKKMMIIGWIIAGAGFLALSRIQSLWQFYGAFVFLALGMSLGSYMPGNALAARWFIRRRSRAITLSALGAGIGGFLIPVLTLIILTFGWRISLVIIGTAAWAICLPLSFFVKDNPEQHGYLPDGDVFPFGQKSTDTLYLSDSVVKTQNLSVREGLKVRAFWLICTMSVFQQLGTSAVYVHIIPYLESLDFPKMQAAYAVSGMAVWSAVGRLGFGFLGDFYSKRHLITIAMTLQTAGLFLFSLIDISRAWLLIVFLLVYASGYGAPIVLRPALLADYFGVRNFGTFIGLIALVSLIGGLSSPVLAGWIFDMTGSYKPAWRIFALVSAPAIPSILFAKPPGIESRQPMSRLGQVEGS